MIYFVNDKSYMKEIEEKFGGSNLMLNKELSSLYRYTVKDQKEVVYINKDFFDKQWEGLKA